MLWNKDLTDTDLIFFVTLTDVNFQNIFIMVTVILKQTYLCLSWKRLKDLNIYENTNKINELYVWILFILMVKTCQGFPNRVNWWGSIWAKWPETAWKLQNQHFWFKTVGDMGHWGYPNFLGSGQGSHQFPPTRKIPACMSQTLGYYIYHCLNKFGGFVSLQNLCSFWFDSCLFLLNNFADLLFLNVWLPEFFSAWLPD